MRVHCGHLNLNLFHNIVFDRLWLSTLIIFIVVKKLHNIVDMGFRACVDKLINQLLLQLIPPPSSCLNHCAISITLAVGAIGVFVRISVWLKQSAIVVAEILVEADTVRHMTIMRISL